MTPQELEDYRRRADLATKAWRVLMIQSRAIWGEFATHLDQASSRAENFSRGGSTHRGVVRAGSIFEDALAQLVRPPGDPELMIRAIMDPDQLVNDAMDGALVEVADRLAITDEFYDQFIAGLGGLAPGAQIVFAMILENKLAPRGPVVWRRRWTWRRPGSTEISRAGRGLSPQFLFHARSRDPATFEILAPEYRAAITRVRGAADQVRFLPDSKFTRPLIAKLEAEAEALADELGHLRERLRVAPERPASRAGGTSTHNQVLRAEFTRVTTHLWRRSPRRLWSITPAAAPARAARVVCDDPLTAGESPRLLTAGVGVDPLGSLDESPSVEPEPVGRGDGESAEADPGSTDSVEPG